MHGDGLGMSVGEAVEEHYFSPTNDSPAAGSRANGSPAAGGTLQANLPYCAVGVHPPAPTHMGPRGQNPRKMAKIDPAAKQAVLGR